MNRANVEFFATRSDLEEIISAIEAAQPLAYVLAGLFDAPTFAVGESLLSIPAIGTATTGNSVLCPRYLVAAPPFRPVVRPVPQRRGGIKYALDQLDNPQTITFAPGGLLGDSVIIAGSLGTASHEPRSLELFALFRTEFRARFAQIRSFRVGRVAAGILDAGGRLTSDVRSPSTYDLSRR